MARITRSGPVVITLNQDNVFAKPETVRKALIDHTDMANK
jgi:hypothetical protein